MEHVFRLTRGQDLKREIVKYAKEKNISAGIILCCVGCVYEVSVRLAGGEKYLNKKGNHEIVSMTGTLTLDAVHIHISLSDSKGNTIGGHLNDGCLVGSTAEICILELNEYKFTRLFDDTTGYKELNYKRK